MKLSGISDKGLKRIAQMVGDEGIEYYFNIYVRFAEEDYEAQGIVIPTDSDEITQAAMQIEDNILSWLDTNIGHTSNTGHESNDELGGTIFINPGSEAHEAVLAALEDEGEEPYSTSKGDFPFDVEQGLPNNMYFDIALSFQRINNWPKEITPEYEAAEAFYQ